MRQAIPSISRFAFAFAFVASSAVVAGCQLLEDMGSETSERKTESIPESKTASKNVPDTKPNEEVTASPPAVPTAGVAPTGSAPGAVGVGGLLPLDRGALPLEKISASKDADKAGDAASETKDYARAEKEHRRAVELDPGNVFARYNLARALVLQNRVSEGVSALGSLKVDGCHLCTERILAASLDGDFVNAKSDPVFIELTKDMHKSLFKVDVAVESIVDWFMTTPRPELLEHEYIDPRSLVVIEDKTKGAKQRFVQLHGSEAFRQHLREHYPKGVYPEGPRTCAKGCCDFTGSPILGVHLKRLCFKTSGTSAVHLHKITIEGDPEASFPG